MRLKTKFIWILFYCFSVLILILTGIIKIRHFSNLWKESRKVLFSMPKSVEDSAWKLVHKNDR